MNMTYCKLNATEDCYGDGVNQPECTVSICDVFNVGLNTNYTVQIAAVTSAGHGPLGDPIFVVTETYGK